MAKDDLLVSDAALRLRARPDVVRNLLFAGILIGRRVGGRWVIAASSVKALEAELARPDGRVHRTRPGCINPR